MLHFPVFCKQVKIILTNLIFGFAIKSSFLMPFNDCYESIQIIQRQCLNISLTYFFIENDKAAEEPHTKNPCSIFKLLL